MKMKSLYLILAATVVAVTCKPQRSNNDIIWYPVDDEEGVFISTFGEKHRTSPEVKWRSHRRARSSWFERPQPLPLSFDPTENHDPSFFHNINERRKFSMVPPIPKIPPSFQDQRFQVKRPNRRPQGQWNQNLNENNIQDIFNEVFDYDKHPPSSDYPGIGSGTTNQWSNRPENQLGENFVSENNNQWGQRPPVNGNQWGSTSGSLVNAGQRPGTTNQWGTSGSLVNAGQRPGTTNQWGTSGSLVNAGQRPGTTNQWGTSGSLVNAGQRPGTTNQWGTSGSLVIAGQRPGTTNQWGSTSGSFINSGQRPSTANQWGSTSGSLVNPEQRPDTTNQWGTSGSLINSGPPTTTNQWGNTRPGQGSTNTEWISQGNTNRPTSRPNRPSGQSDKLVFPNEDTSAKTTSATTVTTTPSNLIPTDPPTMSPCERSCPVTPEFNPVCGSDSVTYSNAGRLKCAQMCGKNIRLSHYGNCGRTSLVTPLVSSNPRPKFGGFWLK